MNNEITTNATEEADDHPYLFEVLFQFWVEIFNFFKFIFYDIYIGG